MSRFSLLLAFLLLGFHSEAQNTTALSKKELRQIVKEERRLANAQALEKINNLVRRQRWVMEASVAYSRSGRSAQLNSSLNFVSVIGAHAIIQLVFQGFDQNPLTSNAEYHQLGQPSVGRNPIEDRVLAVENGVGGLTFQGKVWDYDIIEPKRDNQGVTAIALFATQGGTVQVNLVVKSADRCELTTQWGWGDRLTLKGICVEPTESIVYKAYDSY